MNKCRRKVKPKPRQKNIFHQFFWRRCNHPGIFFPTLCAHVFFIIILLSPYSTNSCISPYATVDRDLDLFKLIWQLDSTSKSFLNVYLWELSILSGKPFRTNNIFQNWQLIKHKQSNSTMTNCHSFTKSV